MKKSVFMKWAVILVSAFSLALTMASCTPEDKDAFLDGYNKVYKGNY